MAVDLVFSSLSPAASSSAVLISVIIVVTYGFLRAFLHLTHDPEEPELVLTGVPFLSPLIEMMRWNFEVFDRVRLVSSLPTNHNQSGVKICRRRKSTSSTASRRAY